MPPAQIFSSCTRTKRPSSCTSLKFFIAIGRDISERKQAEVERDVDACLLNVGGEVQRGMYGPVEKGPYGYVEYARVLVLVSLVVMYEHPPVLDTDIIIAGPVRVEAIVEEPAGSVERWILGISHVLQTGMVLCDVHCPVSLSTCEGLVVLVDIEHSDREHEGV